MPQGSVLSPLLANVSLHYVLDLWLVRDVRPRLHGEAYLVRYADDFICAFELESDARRFLAVLHKRLARFSLELAEEKTKLLRFGRFAEHQYYGVKDNWPSLLRFRRVAVQLGLRWLRRRSQATSMSREAYRQYLPRHDVANPTKIVDLIAMARQAAGTAR